MRQVSRPQKYVFDEVAALYGQVRPGYAPVLVDTAIERAQLPAGGSILEIGCGTGQTLLLLARRK